MKNMLKVIGIIACLAVIGLVVACSGAGAGGGGTGTGTGPGTQTGTEPTVYEPLVFRSIVDGETIEIIISRDTTSRSAKVMDEVRVGDLYEVKKGNEVISRGRINTVTASGNNTIEITFEPSSNSPCGNTTPFTGTINRGDVVSSGALDNGGKLVIPTLPYKGGEITGITAGGGSIILSRGTLAERLQWLRDNAQSDTSYVLEVTEDEALIDEDISYGDRSNITVTLIGIGAERILSLSGNGNIFHIGPGATLILDNNITLQGHINNNAALIFTRRAGRLIMKDGTKITGNGYNGVGVWNESTFTMNGGEISNNVGQGVVVSDESAFTMNGGIISNNFGEYGGVVIWREGSFVMKGGVISDNPTVGVLVCNEGATFIMYDGVITNSNHGVTIWDQGTFTMNGGIISKTSGLGVDVDLSSIFIMNEGEITGVNGGGVRVHGNFTMNGGVISGSVNGGVRVHGNFTMNGGVISGNTANQGGGVAVLHNATFRITNGTIYGSSASDTLKNSASEGAAIWVGFSIAQRGRFSGNTWVSNGDLTTTDNTVRVVNGVLQP